MDDFAKITIVLNDWIMIIMLGLGVSVRVFVAGMKRPYNPGAQKARNKQGDKPGSFHALPSSVFKLQNQLLVFRHGWVDIVGPG